MCFLICFEACRILAPQPGTALLPKVVKAWVLTTGLPGNSRVIPTNREGTAHSLQSCKGVSKAMKATWGGGGENGH